MVRMGDHRVAVVTGSNTGVGLATAKRLIAEAQGKIALTVVLACRSTAKAEAARREILQMYPDAVVELLSLDTSKLESVVAAAEKIHSRYGRLDYLYLNAGIMPVKPMQFNWSALLTTDIRKLMHVLATSEGLLVQEDWKTSDGLNAVFTTNLLGHFLLIEETEDLLVKSQGRIIWTGSNAANRNTYSLSNLQHEGGNDPYGASKYAVDLVTKALNERLNPKGVYVYTCCPGVVLTNVTYGIMPQWIWFFFALPIMMLLRVFERSYTLDPFNGAEGLVMLSGINPALEPNRIGGTNGGMHADPSVKYFSRINVLGHRYITHTPVEGTNEEAQKLYNRLAEMTRKYAIPSR